MSAPTNKCPDCGGTDIEFGGKIWLNRVTIVENPAPEHWNTDEPHFEIVDADPSMSADDDDTGLVWTEDDYLRCCDCDYEFATNHGEHSRAFFERYQLRPAK